MTNIIANRTSAQLITVQASFATIYGEQLQKMLEKELSGNFEKVVISRFYDRWEYQAYVCREAMKGAGTDEQALVDVICPKKPDEMKSVKTAYEQLFKRILMDDIKSEVGGDFGRILYALASASREEKEPDLVLAKADAKVLYEAGEGSWGTDEKVSISIFANRSFEQLRLIFVCYEQAAGKQIFQAIESELKGVLQSAFLTLAQYVMDPILYFSEVLHLSLKGIGTNDSRLVRSLIICDTDLGVVKVEFEKLYEKSLDKIIKKEASGDYKKI